MRKEDIVALAGGRKIVWQPLPGMQELALTCPADEILLDGTRGPGKTDAQLMMFRKHVGQGYGAFWRGVIFDRAYKNLEDLIGKSLRWFKEFDDGASFHYSKADMKWTWPTGEELLFRTIKKPSDYWDYHGQEFPFIGWNELTKFPTSESYELMMSCNRSSFIPPEGSDIPEIPLRVVATTNPYGVGHNWVKRLFIDPMPPGGVFKREIDVFNPRTGQREIIVKTRARLFGSYKENKYLSPLYVAELESLKDENKRRAWLEGDWDIVAGGAFDDLWGDHCLVKRFPIPKGWKIDRSMDWGSSKPFSVGWWAEANGEEILMEDGKRWAPPAGSLFRIYELYGTTTLGTDQGVRLSPKDLAEEINNIEQKLLDQGWIQEKPFGGPADNQIRDVRDPSTPTIEQEMSALGVYWTVSDKSPGSRVIGLELCRQRLLNAKRGEGAGLFFFTNCKAALYILPTLARDEDKPDDVDSEGEDHLYDEMRYRVLSSTQRYTEQVGIAFPR